MASLAFIFQMRKMENPKGDQSKVTQQVWAKPGRVLGRGQAGRSIRLGVGYRLGDAGGSLSFSPLPPCSPPLETW